MQTFNHLKKDSNARLKHYYQYSIELSSQPIDKNSKYNRKLHKLAYHLSASGICNAYLNIRHVVGMFLIG